MTAALFRYNGDGEARCHDCVISVLEANAGMNPANWLDDEFGDTSCDACDATVTYDDTNVNDLMSRMAR